MVQVPPLEYELGEPPHCEPWFDDERVIGRSPLRSIIRVRQFIAEGGCIEFGTRKAAEDARDLLYRLDDVRALLAALGPEHFRNASWCRTSGTSPVLAIPCDAYIVPFARVRGVVQPGWQPQVFVKFGFTASDDGRLLITSFHPEKR